MPSVVARCWRSPHSRSERGTKSLSPPSEGKICSSAAPAAELALLSHTPKHEPRPVPGPSTAIVPEGCGVWALWILISFSGASQRQLQLPTARPTAMKLLSSLTVQPRAVPRSASSSVQPEAPMLSARQMARSSFTGPQTESTPQTMRPTSVGASQRNLASGDLRAMAQSSPCDSVRRQLATSARGRHERKSHVGATQVTNEQVWCETLLVGNRREATRASTALGGG